MFGKKKKFLISIPEIVSSSDSEVKVNESFHESIPIYLYIYIHTYRIKTITIRIMKINAEFASTKHYLIKLCLWGFETGLREFSGRLHLFGSTVDLYPSLFICMVIMFELMVPKGKQW